MKQLSTMDISCSPLREKWKNGTQEVHIPLTSLVRYLISKHNKQNIRTRNCDNLIGIY